MDSIKRILPSRQELVAFANEHFGGEGVLSIEMVLHLMAVADTVRNRLYAPIRSKFGLSEGRFTLLLELKAKERPLPVTTLASNIGISAATCSIMIKRMLQESEPLIGKIGSPRGGNSFLIFITQKGEEVIGKALEVHSSNLKKISSLLGVAQQEQLLELLNKLYGKLA